MDQCIAWEMRREGYGERYRVNKHEKKGLESIFGCLDMGNGV